MRKIVYGLTSLLLCMLAVIPISVQAGSDVYVSDTYGVLTEEEVEKLNKKAQTISEKYDFGLYSHVLYDDSSYFGIWNFAEEYYAEQDLGYGNTSNGILFIITQSKYGGSYNVYVPATSNQDYFTIEGLDSIEDYAEKHLLDHDYYRAIDTFLDKTEEQLEFYQIHGTAWTKEADGTMYYDPDTGRSIRKKHVLIGLGLSFGIAILLVIYNSTKHKTKRTAIDAGQYIPSSGQLRLTRRTDMYLYQTESRTLVKSDSDSGGGGGGGYSSSGGMHSSGGHF